MLQAKRHKIALFLVVYTAIAFSQLQVKNFFSLTGKKNIPVNIIVQDGTGFLWLGTPDGVYKFDGLNSISISKEHGSLKQDITALYIDEDQTTWIGTKTGKLYSFAKNRLDSVVIPANDQIEKITSICKIGSSLFFGTYGNGIYLLRQGKLDHYTSTNGLSDNVVYKITGDKMHRAWCGTDAGITEINMKSGQPVFTVISNKNGLPDNIVRDISLLDDRILISMQDSGICHYNLKTKQIEKSQFFMNWSKGTVMNAISCTSRKMVVATEKEGLLLFENGALSSYNYNELLQTDQINQLFIDREKQLWIASKNGLSQFIERRFNFINSSKGLQNDNVLALVVDNDNGLWLGSTMGISRIISDADGKLIISKIQELKKYTISCAAKAPDGNIWFGTYGSGIIVLSSDNKNEIILDGKDDMMANGNISNIFFPDKNIVYVSTLGGGLIKAKISLSEKKKVTIEKVYTENEGLGSNYVYSALTDDHSRLYVATDGGGLQVLENGKFLNLTKQFKFASNTVFSLCKDKNNNIWATSNADGILKYDGRSMIAINSAMGLRDEQPQQIIASNNILFAINSKGIDKINCQDNSVSYYDLFDGDLEPNLNAIFFHDNKIYSGTNNGILVYRTSQQAFDSIRPSVFIKSFQLNFKPFPLDSIYEFKYDQNNIQLGFDGIWLKNPGKLTYRYRLHGLESNWIYSGKGETVNYSNLNPGNYTFMVQVKNEEDVWSDPTGYSFIILKPIWKHWWFWVLVIGVGTLSIYSLVRYRLKALQRENLLLERRVKERTSQIEKQSQIITQKNKDITDSISYARKIQHAILPADALIKTHLPNSFTLYMTKDIVSGDFYWFTHFDDFSIIAAVDCTGHGVPGAFMSLIGYNLLNKIVNEQKITDPKQILLELNNGVLEALHKNESESKDGMDTAICKINHKQNTIDYAGAMRPLWIINNGNLTEIKADKIPIGTKQADRDETIAYTTHHISIKKGDLFYIFTDGYADQFGGPNDKKFSTGKFKELLIANSKFDFATQELNARQEHNKWKGENEQVDDILLIGFAF